MFQFKHVILKNVKKCISKMWKNVKKCIFLKQFWGFVLLCFAPGNHCFAIAKLNNIKQICDLHSPLPIDLNCSSPIFNLQKLGRQQSNCSKTGTQKNQTWRKRNQSSTFPTGFSNFFHMFFAFFTFFVFFSHNCFKHTVQFLTCFTFFHILKTHFFHISKILHFKITFVSHFFTCLIQTTTTLL